MMEGATGYVQPDISQAGFLTEDFHSRFRRKPFDLFHFATLSRTSSHFGTAPLSLLLFMLSALPIPTALGTIRSPSSQTAPRGRAPGAPGQLTSDQSIAKISARRK